MTAAEPVREAGEAMSSLGRQLARCLVLAAAAVAAWLLASGVASAADTDPADTDPVQPATSLLDGDADVDDVVAVLDEQTPADPSVLGELASPAALPSPFALPGSAALPGSEALPSLMALPGSAQLPVPMRLPVDVEPATGVVALPDLTSSGELPLVRPPAHGRPFALPTGDRELGMVAASPAVAADAPSPAPVPARTWTTFAGRDIRPASAATPAPLTGTSPAPAHQPCLPSPSMPAHAAGAAASAGTVVTVASAGSSGRRLPVGGPPGGPIRVRPVAEQPGTTPD